jgi:hypothetical protein
MAALVWLTHRGLVGAGVHYPWLQVLIEIVVGAIGYVCAALVICRDTAKDLLQLVGKALKK